VDLADLVTKNGIIFIRSTFDKYILLFGPRLNVCNWRLWLNGERFIHYLYTLCIYTVRSDMSRRIEQKSMFRIQTYIRRHVHTYDDIYIYIYIYIYILDQKVPGIHSENSKYKFYSSKVILSSSKYSPSTATHLYQRLIQLSKYIWNFIIGIAIRAVFDFSITSC